MICLYWPRFIPCFEGASSLKYHVVDSHEYPHQDTLYWYHAILSFLARSDRVWKVEFESPFRSSQRLKNWHLLLPWLVFTIKGLEQCWLAQCQFKVTGWGIVFICRMVLQCADTLKLGLSLDQLQQI